MAFLLCVCFGWKFERCWSWFDWLLSAYDIRKLCVHSEFWVIAVVCMWVCWLVFDEVVCWVRSTWRNFSGRCFALSIDADSWVNLCQTREEGKRFVCLWFFSGCGFVFFIRSIYVLWFILGGRAEWNVAVSAWWKRRSLMEEKSTPKWWAGWWPLARHRVIDFAFFDIDRLEACVSFRCVVVGAQRVWIWLQKRASPFFFWYFECRLGYVLVFVCVCVWSLFGLIFFLMLRAEGGAFFLFYTNFINPTMNC